MHNHKGVETVDNYKLDTGWTENDNIGKRYVDQRSENLDTVPEFFQMWNGCSGRVDMANYRFEVTTPDILPINSAFR